MKNTLIYHSCYQHPARAERQRRHLLGWSACLIMFILTALCPAKLCLAKSVSTPAQYNILILGDSLSSAYGIPQDTSWVSLLSAELATGFNQTRVINASISGETTGGGRTRLPALLERHDPALVILELGGNDGLRGFPVSVIRNNLEAMIRLSQANGSEVLILGMKIPPNYGVQYTQQFFTTYQLLAQKYNLAIIPFLLEGIALNNKLMQNDGIHPNVAAQPTIMKKVLDKLYPLIVLKLPKTSE
jgi:acyl-CoA thioesterase-1